MLENISVGKGPLERLKGCSGLVVPLKTLFFFKSFVIPKAC